MNKQGSVQGKNKRQRLTAPLTLFSVVLSVFCLVPAYSLPSISFFLAVS